MCCWSRSLIRVRAAWYFCGFTIPPGGRKGTVRDTHQMNFWNLTSRTTYLTPSSRLLTIPCSISKEKASSCLMERFNGDPGVLNKTFVLNGTARTLIGIMPPRFGWYGADVWIPETPIPGAAIGGAGSTRRWFLLSTGAIEAGRLQAASCGGCDGYCQPAGENQCAGLSRALPCVG